MIAQARFPEGDFDGKQDAPSAGTIGLVTLAGLAEVG